MAESLLVGDIFALLPGPVLEMIAVQLDLSSLHNLYRYSPTIACLLHEDGTARRTIEKILHLTLPKHTQEALIRKFAFLRWAFLDWNTRAVKDLNTFIAQFIKSDEEYFSFPREIPLSILFDTLVAAATIRYLTFDILHKMIDCCKKLELCRMENPKKKIYTKSFAGEQTFQTCVLPCP